MSLQSSILDEFNDLFEGLGELEGELRIEIKLNLPSIPLEKFHSPFYPS